MRTFQFWGYDRVHYFVVSYRVEDEEECANVLAQIVHSFRLK